MKRLLHPPFLCIVLLISGCANFASSGENDNSDDASVPDASPTPPVDAGPGTPDAGPDAHVPPVEPDAGEPDASTPDATPTCSDDSDCLSGEECDDGVCEPDCDTEYDDSSGDPNAPPGISKYKSYLFEFENGEVVSGTSGPNTITVTAGGFTMNLHISCSDAYLGPDEVAGTPDDGFGETQDPTEADGHPRVNRYHIWKYKNGELKKECSDGPFVAECLP